MNTIDLAGRVAVITGGARGIGFATAERFLRSGAKVAIWDIDEARAKHSADELAALGTVSAHVVELTDESAIQNALAETLAAHSRLDIVVNNAGITGGNGLTWELDPKVCPRRSRQ
jgi:3-oxoacyl-[acyl-carrier protein] reductase